MTDDANDRLVVEEDFVAYDVAKNPGNRIDWADLNEVYFVTTDRGPVEDDAFFFLQGKSESERCIVPQEPTTRLSDRLMKLPGFDFETFIGAMGSVDNRRFLLWRKRT